MELHARLIHAEAGLRVVEVRASRGDHNLGSALAEAATAHEAEDLAVARLLRRLRDLGPATIADGPVPAASSPVPGGAAASTQPQVNPRPRRASAAAPPSLLTGGTAMPPAGSRAAAPSPAIRATDRAHPQPDPAGVLAPPSPQLQGHAVAHAPAALPQPASQTEGDLTAGTAADPLGAESAAEPHQTSYPPAPPPAPAGGRPTTAEDAAIDPQSDPQEEPPADPEDWSQELTAVDLQLRRLGWNREQEGLYLQRAFGHPSRSRLTRYSDLRAYLVALEALQPGSDPALADVPLRRSELLAQGDALLRQLGWSAEQGRAFLERQLERVSRQQLSDVQLLQFNMLLEGELLAADAAAPATAPEGAQR